MKKNKNKKNNHVGALMYLVIISFVLANFFIIPNSSAATADDITALNQKIDTKKQSIDALRHEIEAYQQQIKAKQQEASTLKNQIIILSNQIAKVNLDIQSTQAQIDETNLEIESLNISIKITEQKIIDRKEKLSEYIRLIDKNDKISYLEVLLTNNAFSDFFDQVEYTQQIHHDISTMLNELKKDQADLMTQKNTWQQKAEQENQLKNQLLQQQASLQEENSAHQTLLSQAKMSERQYQSYTYQLQLQQQQTNADIVTLEKQVRAKLEAQQAQDRFKSFGPARFDWPISPVKGISAYFHDPGYPFRYIFEHPAVDIRAPQGTPIKAAEAGYVAKVQFKGDKSYAYIMLIHSDGFSTVYGHISGVYVKQDEYVSKGESIGLSGATPGTIGAGPLTTGPHLHFEVRLNGIPVNPLEYLPPM